MKLFENIGNSKGITLNSQLVDLLSIIDDDSLTKEEQDIAITEYVSSLQARIDSIEEGKKQYLETYGDSISRIICILESIIDDIPGDVTEEQKQQVKNVYLDIMRTHAKNSTRRDFSIMDSEMMRTRIADLKIKEDVVEYILTEIKDRDYDAKEGILEMTPDKVRALHSFMFENGNKFDFINVDNAGKYSGYVSFDGETVAPSRLDKMFEFAQRHGMQTKINTFMFYADFPDLYEAYCMHKYTTSEMTPEEKKNVIAPYIKATLFNYVRNVCDRYGEQISAVDVLNEIIYDPDMIEENYRGSEEHTYHQRTGQWMKYLTVDDLVELALITRKKLPNARLLYNDMNWVNPNKRREIIVFVKKLQEKEKEFRETGRLGVDERGIIDFIGLEAHLATDIDIEELDRTLSDVEREIGLPVEVTELDIARTGDNPLSEEEVLKQQAILARIYKLANQVVNGNPRISAITMWSQSDDMCFVDNKCKRKVYGSVLDSNFEEKEFQPEITKEIDNQKFNFHTHTSLCGHASGEMREYIEKAIEAGIHTLGFSDHNPPALGKNRPKDSMSMQQFQEEYLPELRGLREEYSDRIDIKIGLEVEYYGEEGEEVSTIKESREKIEPELDYMILGQHFVIARDENNKMINPPRMSDPLSGRYPIDYANSVVEAMKTGKFAYVAHPDLFLQHRDKVKEDQKEEYTENSRKAIEMICETAAKYKIPLEVNLGGISAVEAGIPGKGLLQDGTYPYPVPEFWRVAAEKGCDVLIGVDAHDPNALIDRKSEKIAKKIMRDAGIELHYLENFEPLGIGKELGRITNGRKVLNQIVELSDELRAGEINDEVGIIRRTVKNVEKIKNIDEEQI